ncbi:MAG: tetratricopeptide repeat protein, partial [Deferribacteres bacterium]|nr:tetratricopeptide repeat protein [Deferribacteres bacterium]
MKRKTVCIYYSAAVVIFSLLFSLSISFAFAADDYELYIARGIDNLNKGNYSEALQLLKKALELAPEDREALYYTAVAYSRLGRYRQAEELFLKILKEGGADANVYLELGRLYAARGECLESQKYLSRFISLSDDDALKKHARNLLENCNRPVGRKKLYNLSLTGGGQYDDNVIVEPENPVVAADRKRDGRFVAYLTADATLLETAAISLKAGYNFYQSLHEHLSGFNVQYHKITPSFDITISDAFSVSAGYALEYTVLGKEEYSRFHTYSGKITVKETGKLSTEVIYKYKDHKYWDTDTFKSNS